ncbi:PLP-dependent aminotransferase family protein [Roseovarius sp. EL26]|uniref:MocR-like pyridoxine biosynthesis transcription factor PdxR n=1 Tax=Roseovarius sp. EL26 TaxID=2126672 RepID=UPI000EA3DF3A|nr:PLP-dependent aminotransferase family protein [Roseovarius sp. EL26]
MKQTPWLALSIDRSTGVPIFEQICEAIRSGVIAGELTQGQTLPPTRVFATEIGVSRSTIVTAYEQLVAEGYLHSIQGSGYTICATGEVELAHKPAVTPSATPREENRKPRPFLAGQPDMRLFPYRQWAKTVARLCRTNPQSMLSSGSAFGNFELRQAISTHVAEWRGITASPHQIIITAGSMDALEICMRTLTQSGDGIGLENPGYLPLRRFVKDMQLRPSFMDLDANGATIPQGAPPRLVVLTPSHQYPMGGAMTPNRRLEFIQWADAQNAWIVEDDYDSEFRYAGRPIPAMAGFDQINRTIYIGSFSKIFSNSLRLGYVIVPEALLGAMRDTIVQQGQHASSMPQQPLAEFIKSGEFYRHLRRVRRIYGERRKFLLERLEQDFGEYGHFTDHQAGMQIVFHLTGYIKDTVISERAQQLGLTVAPLSAYASGNVTQNGLILGFCGYTEDEIAQSLILLRQTMA